MEGIKKFVNNSYTTKWGGAWENLTEDFEPVPCEEPTAAISYAVKVPYSLAQRVDLMGRCFHDELVLVEHEGGERALIRPVWIDHDEKSRFEIEVVAACVNGKWAGSRWYLRGLPTMPNPDRPAEDSKLASEFVTRLLDADWDVLQAEDVLRDAEGELDLAVERESSIAEEMFVRTTGRRRNWRYESDEDDFDDDGVECY